MQCRLDARHWYTINVDVLHGHCLAALLKMHKNLFCELFGQIYMYEICSNDNFLLYVYYGTCLAGTLKAS